MQCQCIQVLGQVYMHDYTYVYVKRWSNPFIVHEYMHILLLEEKLFTCVCSFLRATSIEGQRNPPTAVYSIATGSFW